MKPVGGNGSWLAVDSAVWQWIGSGCLWMGLFGCGWGLFGSRRCLFAVDGSSCWWMGPVGGGWGWLAMDGVPISAGWGRLAVDGGWLAVHGVLLEVDGACWRWMTAGW